jgi:hypothetical protein
MRFIQLFALILALTLLAIPLAAQSSASSDFMPCQQTLSGHRYAFTFQGFLNLGPSIGLTPNAGGGMISFKADGTFSASTSLSVGGMIVPLTMQGTYEMHLDTRTMPPSCAGTATADDGTTFQLVSSRTGDTLEQMHTDQGLVVAITNTPMEKSRCSNRTLHTNYVYVANGFFAPPPPASIPQAFGNYTPFTFSGVISFDGKGGLSGWDTVSLAGNVVPRTYSGSYEVKRNCTATMELNDTLGNIIHTINFIHQDAKKLSVVNTDPGTVLAFNATRE